METKISKRTIVFDLPKTFKNIGFKTSGGTDSSILGYMLFKYVSEERPDLTIIPVTIEKYFNPYHIKFSKYVFDFCKEKFPDVKTGEFQTAYAPFHEWTDILDKLLGWDVAQLKFMTKIKAEKIIDCSVVGLTTNPPGMYFSGRGFRTPIEGLVRPEVEETSYYPLRNIDKKGVYELYKHFGLLESLLPLTRSCESVDTKLTDNFKKHCAECFRCNERKWAFPNPNNKFDTDYNDNNIYFNKMVKEDAYS